MPELRRWTIELYKGTLWPIVAQNESGDYGPKIEPFTKIKVIESAPVEAELERLHEKIASDEGSFREALTALKLVADQRDAIKVKLERLRKVEAAMSQHIDRACTCGAKVEEDGNTWHESRCPAVNPETEEFFAALREALEI